MSDITVITNGVPRDVVDAWEVPADVRAEFDYVDWDACERGEDSASFVRYRGEWYDLGDIPAVDRASVSHAPFLARWHGVLSDSFFSGILVRYADETCETVVMGRYYA